MDFYSALERIVRQIPEGNVAFAVDIANALGDRSATVSLPASLLRIHSKCKVAVRVVRADGSPMVPGVLTRLEREGLDVSGSRIVSPESHAFRGFRTGYPLRELRESQLRLSKDRIPTDTVSKPETVAGVDVSYDDDHGFAAAVVVEAKTLRVLRRAMAEMNVDFPYIPGYLAFRELPLMLRALRKLPIRPQLVLVDGHGILHPAMFGVACHVGVEMKLPTIGVAKSHLIGEPDSESLSVGQATAVRLGHRILGYALRSSSSSRPIYISPGNMVSPRTAVKLVRMVCHSRIPEPIRLADAIAREKRREKSRL